MAKNSSPFVIEIDALFFFLFWRNFFLSSFSFPCGKIKLIGQKELKLNPLVYLGSFYSSRRLDMASTVRLYVITFMCMASRLRALLRLDSIRHYRVNSILQQVADSMQC